MYKSLGERRVARDWALGHRAREGDAHDDAPRGADLHDLLRLTLIGYAYGPGYGL